MTNVEGKLHNSKFLVRYWIFVFNKFKCFSSGIKSQVSVGLSTIGAKCGGDTFTTASYSGGQAVTHSPHLTQRV